MSDQDKLAVGTVVWRDLTVENAVDLSKFYESVVGWKVKPEEMGGYSDFSMIAPGPGDTVAGICHARGPNAKLPPLWLMYVIVEDVDRSAARCLELGGKVLDGPRPVGGGSVCVIQDPAGAVCALYRPQG